MGDCAEYMLDCDLLNEDSQKLIDRTGLPRHMARQKTMNRDEIIRNLTDEGKSIRIYIEPHQTEVSVIDESGDEEFDSIIQGKNDLPGLQDVYQQYLDSLKD